MSAKQMNDRGRWRKWVNADAAGAIGPAGTNASVKMALCLLIACLVTQGCSAPPSVGHRPDDGANAPGGETGGWPCDSADLASPHCRLQVAEGFQQSADDRAMRFENIELDATLTARVIQGPKGACADGAAPSIMAAWQARLSPAVTWDQDPQGPVGFEVRGISGSERLALTADPGQLPQQFHIVSYCNPRTGSILLLEARAAQNHWKQVWPRLAPVFAAVRLTREF